MAIIQRVSMKMSLLRFLIIITSLLIFIINSAYSLPPAQQTSHIWSGYVVHPSQLVTSVSGEWLVQQFLNSPTPRYLAQWVGIGGYHIIPLVQIGTDSFYKCTISGCPPSSYYAWYQLVGINNGMQFLFPVNADDLMYAKVDITGQNANATAMQRSAWILNHVT